VKPLYIAACGLLIVAIAADVISKRQASEVITLMLKSGLMSGQDKTDALAAAADMKDKSELMSDAGLYLAIAGFLTWLVSLLGKKRGAIAPPLLLVSFYLLLYLVMRTA
jgi:hypothetical protein